MIEKGNIGGKGMLRKPIAILLMLIFCFSSIALAAENKAEMTVLGKVIAVENAFYGSEQTGSLLERIGKLERDLYGAETNNAMVAKMDAIYDNVFHNTSGPSLIMKANSVEWAIMHEVSTAPIKTRIENMEMMIHGTANMGSYTERLSSLMQLSFVDGDVTLVNKFVEPDTLVKIKLVTSIDSKASRVGDAVHYVAAEDVVYQGALLVAKGAEGTGIITKVSQAQNFGRDAKIEIDFQNITTLDGTKMNTFLGEKAQKETETMVIAAGATVAGLAILGPVGIVTGAFIKGKNIEIPEGTEIYIQTKNESSVDGIQIEAL